jgi:hypothetical protein
LRTRKGSLLEDVKLPVFTSRALSVTKVLAVSAVSVGQGHCVAAAALACWRSICCYVSEWVLAAYGHVEG